MAAPSRRPPLLQPAHTIARRDGAEAVTLDAVAAEAAVSKDAQR
jgi:DNA-binding transcriptional regulator YbjK